ncbi:MAG: hypothetical protein J6K55_12560 [Clostridia bacterium]|nr:hypothetical protein [Clostridia bacterium]
MARLEFEGLDKAIQQMDRMGHTTGPVADQMLQAGAAPMKKAWQDAITRYGHVDTGSMKRSVGYEKKSKNGHASKSLDVYPRGKDRKGVRNAEKAFVLHYGRKNMSGTHFVDAAEAEGKPESEAAMLAVWDRFLEKG